MRVQNPPKRLGTDSAVGGPAGCDLSAVGFPLVVVDRGGAVAGRDSAGAPFRDSATATWRSGTSGACYAVAGVLTGLCVRDSVVCRDLLLDLLNHAPIWRDAGSDGRAGADFVLHVRRALPRNVWDVAGAGRRGWESWVE